MLLGTGDEDVDHLLPKIAPGFVEAWHLFEGLPPRKAHLSSILSGRRQHEQHRFHLGHTSSS